MTGSRDSSVVARADVRADIQEFLTTRLARVSPEQAGVPVFGADRRRVVGLRRDEVAVLAGISSQYYTRLEPGNAAGVSEGVIDGIMDALRPDEAERAHFLDLIRAASTTRPPKRPAPQRIRPAIQRILDSMIGTPAFVLSGRLDILAANQLGAALFAPAYTDPVRPPNNARFVFLNPQAGEFFRDWDTAANDAVALLSSEAGRHRHDRRLFDLVGELSTRSADFRSRWAAHDVRIHNNGREQIHHPMVGDLDLRFESFPVEAISSTSILCYTARTRLAVPGSA